MKTYSDILKMMDSLKADYYYERKLYPENYNSFKQWYYANVLSQYNTTRYHAKKALEIYNNKIEVIK